MFSNICKHFHFFRINLIKINLTKILKYITLHLHYFLLEIMVINTKHLKFYNLMENFINPWIYLIMVTHWSCYDKEYSLILIFLYFLRKYYVLFYFYLLIFWSINQLILIQFYKNDFLYIFSLYNTIRHQIHKL